MIASSSQLLLAIAEHETLEKACAALGISRDDALKLLRGAAVRLQNEKPEPPHRLDGQRKVFVFSDGAARGNPGPAGAGAVVKSADGKVIAECDKSLVNKYERIRKQRGGVAVVAVVAGTCKGCQRNIPPQMANNLLTSNEILSCPNCHRFIYAAEEQQAVASA